MANIEVGDLITCSNYGGINDTFGVVLYISNNSYWCVRGWPGSASAAIKKAKDWLKNNPIPKKQPSGREVSSNGKTNCSLHTKDVLGLTTKPKKTTARTYETNKVGTAVGAPVSVPTTCECTHSFLASGCTCGAIKPYKTRY